MVALGQTQTDAQSGLKQGKGGCVQDVVEVGAACVQTAVATSFEQDAGEVQDGFHQLSVTLDGKAAALDLCHVAACRRSIFTISLRQYPNLKGLCLRAFVERVFICEEFQDAVEAVECIDPVVEIAARKGPVVWEGVQKLRQFV